MSLLKQEKSSIMHCPLKGKNQTHTQVYSLITHYFSIYNFSFRINMTNVGWLLQ